MRCNPLTVLATALAAFAADPAEFAGEWRAEHEGKAFLVLKVRNVGGKVAGSLRQGSVTVDQTGKVLDASEASTEEHPLLEVEVTGGKLRFKAEDNDGDIEGFQMSIATDGTATLKIDGMPEGVKPVRLRRVRN